MTWVVDECIWEGLHDTTQAVLELIDVDQYEVYLNQTADKVLIDGVLIPAGTALRRAGEATFQESAWQWVESLHDSVRYQLDSMDDGCSETIHGVDVECYDFIAGVGEEEYEEAV